MLIYILIIIQILICAYFYDLRSYQKNKKFWVNYTMVVLILLAGLRYRIGTDSAFYELEFANFPKLWKLSPNFFSNSRYAPLYLVFTSLLRSITSQFWIEQLIISTFVNYSVFRIIKKYGKGNSIFIFVLFYFGTLYYSLNCEVLREAIAVAIFLYAIDCLIKREYIKYYALVVLAVGFHFGAIYMVVVPLFKLIRINKKFVVVSIIIFFIFPIIRSIPFFESFFALAANVGIFGNMAMEYYAEGGDFTTGDISINQLVMQYILPVASCLYVRKRTGEYEKVDFLLVAYLFTMWLSVLFIPILIRFNDYFGIFYYVFYAAAVVELAKQFGHRHFGAMLLCLSLFFYTNHNYWANSYINEKLSNAKRIELINPYTTVLMPHNIQERDRIYIELIKY